LHGRAERCHESRPWRGRRAVTYERCMTPSHTPRSVSSSLRICNSAQLRPEH
jgi:hypothetical protein